MLVQHDEPRDDALAGEIDDRRAGRRRRARRGADCGDIAVADDDRLIVVPRRAGAVDDPRVYQRENRRLHFDVRRERIRRLLRASRPQRLRDEQGAEHSGSADLQAARRVPILPTLPLPPIQPLLPIQPLVPSQRTTSAAIAPRSSLPCPFAIASSIAFAILGSTVIG